jgi:hypothetical protein
VFMIRRFRFRMKSQATNGPSVNQLTTMMMLNTIGGRPKGGAFTGIRPASA